MSVRRSTSGCMAAAAVTAAAGALLSAAHAQVVTILYVVLACTILLFWRGDSPVSASQGLASHPARREYPSQHRYAASLAAQYPHSASPTFTPSSSTHALCRRALHPRHSSSVVALNHTDLSQVVDDLVTSSSLLVTPIDSAIVAASANRDRTQLPEGFDWQIYLLWNGDVKAEGYDTQALAEQHFLTNGMHEERLHQKARITLR